MSMGWKHRKGFEMAVKCLWYIPSGPKAMDPIAVLAVLWEEVNVNRTQRRKILHLKAYFSLRLTAPKSEVTELGKRNY
jgi:hypothetical protein